MRILFFFRHRMLEIVSVKQTLLDKNATYVKINFTDWNLQILLAAGVSYFENSNLFLNHFCAKI